MVVPTLYQPREMVYRCSGKPSNNCRVDDIDVYYTHDWERSVVRAEMNPWAFLKNGGMD